MSTTCFANYTMTSAPSLNTTDTVSLCNVLDACLVNGFGGYTAPGWNILYSSQGQRCYQAKEGNQFPLYINESNNPSFGTYQGNVATWYGMEAWNGPNNLPTNRFPTTTTYPMGMPLQKWYSSTATGIPWWFFGNGSCFWFIVGCYTNSGSYGTANAVYRTIPFFYGDFISEIPGYSYNTAIIGMGANGYTSWSNSIMQGYCLNAFPYSGRSATSANTGFGSASTSMFVARSYNGNDLSPASSILYRGVIYYGDAGFGGSYFDPQTNIAMFDQPFISVGGNEACPIGRIPGFWNSVTADDNRSYNSGDTITDTDYSSTATFYVFNDKTYTGYLIEYDPVNPWS